MNESVQSTSEQAPSQEEIELAASVLSRLRPGFLPKELFGEVTRLWTTSIVEVVPVRHGSDGSEVLLFERPADDPNWPGQLHTPGTVVRPTDVSDDGSIDKPLQRIYESELGFQPEANPNFVGSLLHQVHRGTESATVLYLDLTDVETPAGTWHDARNLPVNLVETQRGFIDNAVSAFERNQQ